MKRKLLSKRQGRMPARRHGRTFARRQARVLAVEVEDLFLEAVYHKSLEIKSPSGRTGMYKSSFIGIDMLAALVIWVLSARPGILWTRSSSLYHWVLRLPAQKQVIQNIQYSMHGAHST